MKPYNLVLNFIASILIITFSMFIYFVIPIADKYIAGYFFVALFGFAVILSLTLITQK
jgi:hypothetical protein